MAEGEKKLTIADYKQKLERARAWGRAMKEDYQAGIQRGVDNLLVTSGGATVGIMRGLWGDERTGDVILPGLDMEADIVIGTILSGLGVFGIAGNASNMLNMYGAGINAAVLARELEKSLKASQAAAKAKETKAA